MTSIRGIRAAKQKQTPRLSCNLRFLAGALSPYITWEPVEATSARATMQYEGSRGSGTFFFDEDGRVTNMIANRFDREYGAVVPWSTPLQEHGEFDGIRVPTLGTAVYTRDSGDYTYIRVRVTDIEYDVPVPYGKVSCMASNRSCYQGTRWMHR